MTWGPTQLAQELQRLLAPGVIGLYRSFEVTEIFGTDRSGQPTNILTLLVAEPGEPPATQGGRPELLTPKRIELKGTELKFGVGRYRIAPQVLLDAIERFGESGEWKPGFAALKVGTLAAVPPQFVPSDAYPPHPWNRVLKNNFWEGSHVLELFDTTKPHVHFLLEESRQLTALAERIRPHVPMDIDGLSDRLGNILIQLPVTVVSTAERGLEGDYLLQTSWHPKVTPRPLRVSCEIYEDDTVDAFGSQTVKTDVARFELHSPGGGARTVIWDDANQVILGASAKASFFTSVAVSVHVDYMEGDTYRQFLLAGPDGQVTKQSVPLKLEERPNRIGSLPHKPQEPWRQERVFKQSLSALQERKEFVQYGAVAGAGRSVALEDIKWLMTRHGATGVWLWDPFLDAGDVLQTLFFCPHRDSDLRALTAGKQPSESDGTGLGRAAEADAAGSWKHRVCARWDRVLLGLRCRKAPAPPWKEVQRGRLEGAKCNGEGLQFEFRIRQGNAGWSFHDRFIIFPRERGGALAWSLGTSVNSLGRQHHILQRVANGEQIRNAFLELWDSLAAADYLVWKTP